jgi:hypothetical protein
MLDTSPTPFIPAQAGIHARHFTYSVHPRASGDLEQSDV